MKRVGFFVLVGLIFGCTKTSDGSGKPTFKALRDRSANAHEQHTAFNDGTNAGKSAPKVVTSEVGTRAAQASLLDGSQHIVGHGVGTTRHEAVVSAIASVSRQIMSKIKGSISTRTYEDDNQSEGAIEQRIRTESAFPYAELIKVVAVEQKGGSFSVVAALNKAEARQALERNARHDLATFELEVPRIEKAVKNADYGVLLNQRFNPSNLLRNRRKVNRMLSALGGSLPPTKRKKLQALAASVAAARSKARVHLKTTGEVPLIISRAVESLFANRLRSLGCQLVAHDTDQRDTVEFELRLRTRNHEEFDAKWIYLGFELKAHSKQARQVVLSINGMPEFVHGGGLSNSQAEQAVIGELKEKLEAETGLFDALVCAESI